MKLPEVKHVLYIDAYDSFARNIISLVECSLKVLVTSVTIDFKWPDGNMAKYIRQFDAIIVGPGPGNPTHPPDIGIINDLWDVSDNDMVPILGICLGFQNLCRRYGATVKRLPEPRHGLVTKFMHHQQDIFQGLPCFSVTLYHSLQVELGYPAEKRTEAISSDQSWNAGAMCPELVPLAWFSEPDVKGVANLMAVRHKEKPFWGFQFHPESCMSEEKECVRLIKNWWSSANEFNTKRNIHRIQPERSGKPSATLSKPRPLVSEMLHLSSSATNTLTYRSLDQCRLTAEMICEIVDIPNIPSVVLESNARYSIISVPSPGSWRLEYSVAKKRCLLERIGKLTSSNHVPLDEGVEIWDVLREVLMKKQVTSGNEAVPFWGGFMGFFSYEVGLEKWGFKTPDHVDGDETCDVSLLWVERSIVIDKKTKKIYIQSTRRSDELSGEWLDTITQRLKRFSHNESLEAILLDLAVSSPKNLDKNDYIRRLRNSDPELANLMVQGAEIVQPNEKAYKARIRGCQEYIRSGESYELCLTDETKVSLPACQEEQDREIRPWVLYRRLRKYNPASFSAYAKLGNLKIISSSPECFLQWDRIDTLEMKPMKGTVKKSPEMTFEKAEEILRTPKEMGENLMIADLIRHDLFTVCGSGGVVVEKLMEVEDHTRVYQLVTHILGKISHLSPRALVNGQSAQQNQQSMLAHGCAALNTCLPPGSMTGAPKKRSCELLSRLENRSRSAYSGAMGYLDVGGGGSFSVLIRMAYSWSPSADSKENSKETWRIGAGGAITHLSTAEGEWDEMQTKLNTVLAIFRPIPEDSFKFDNQKPQALKALLEDRRREREERWDVTTSGTTPMRMGNGRLNGNANGDSEEKGQPEGSSTRTNKRRRVGKSNGSSR